MSDEQLHHPRLQGKEQQQLHPFHNVWIRVDLRCGLGVAGRRVRCCPRPQEACGREAQGRPAHDRVREGGRRAPVRQVRIAPAVHRHEGRFGRWLFVDCPRSQERGHPEDVGDASRRAGAHPALVHRPGGAQGERQCSPSRAGR